MTTTGTNTIDATHRLAGLVAALPATTSPEDAGLLPVTATAVDEIVWVYSRGQYRRGVVTKVTRTRAEVAYTTQGALDISAKMYATWAAATEDQHTGPAARQAHDNWAHKTAMANGTSRHYRDFADLYTPERKQAEMAKYAEDMAKHGSQEAYIQSEVDRARAFFAEKKAGNTGPLAYATITRKSCKISELFRDPWSPR